MKKNRQREVCGQSKRQTCLRSDAERFLDWCRWDLRPCLEKLDAADKKEFESGNMPEKVLDAVRAAWSSELKKHLPAAEQSAAIRKVLTNPRDYDTLMNCPWGQLQTVPKRIRIAVAKALTKRAEEIHAAFFAKDGEARLANYLRVWQSQKRARTKLMIQALGYKLGGQGDASLGDIPLDAERMLLSEVEATGSVFAVRGLMMFIANLWRTESPHRSEARLNRFLMKLGRALADTTKRRELPDWLTMDQTLRYVVEGWCESIIVDGERWPPLCLLTTLALAEFLKNCKATHCKQAVKNPRTIERRIRRLGLVSIRHGKIRQVEKRFGVFRFA